ncbi:Crp/Fnr family transcriptional regulator [Ideonella sp. 4Y16]|uniref:Crp/Fnr family transcriptional regulator n=1 Tax=Ideonella alba TaxID=2824118 RepID=A0A940Y8X6_9BURK|nr:Crp/Fnr family transcriptional regulator [Ideonella alba]MBQ0932199.1 Crp/Fnr family transcriptional regulator [Ideonella alba]MBQ0943704.1 Crp/Fnr family transcriptional regulator [Ideonella alba]
MPRSGQTPTDDWLTPLRAGRWFADLGEPAQRALLAEARCVTLGAGDTLFRRGDACDGLYAVLDGAVRIGAVDAAGRDLLLQVLGAPHWFGEIAVIDGGARTHDVSARGECRLLQVPQAALQALLADDPLWWRHLGRLLAEKSRALLAGLEQIAALPAPQRIALRLLALAEGHGMLAPGVVQRELALNQEQLGAMLALTRQTVSETLGDFEARGWLRRGYGRIELLNADALRALADQPPKSSGRPT